MLIASSRRWRGLIASGVSPSVNATISCRGSVAAVTSAIAADASRGVRPGTPAISPQLIEPDTSSASSMRLPVGSTLPNAA